MTGPVTIPPEVLDFHQAELAAWVRANGIDPRDVPLAHPLHLHPGDGHGLITYRAYVRTPDGHKQADPDDPAHARTEQRTTPCLVPLPSLALLPDVDGQEDG